MFLSDETLCNEVSHSLDDSNSNRIEEITGKLSRRDSIRFLGQRSEFGEDSMSSWSHPSEHTERHSHDLCSHRLAEFFVFLLLVLFSNVGSSPVCGPVWPFQLGWSDRVDHSDITEDGSAIEVEEEIWL